MTGRIIKGIAGFYYVAVAGSGIYECKAKGLFRKIGIKPLVGDLVEIMITHEADKEANIMKILPRKNDLYRPAVANVDRILLVAALAEPEPNLQVIDRFLIQMKRRGVEVMICLNKADLTETEKAALYEKTYRGAGYEVLTGSARDPEYIGAIRECLEGKITVLTGPSGVGKSTIVNAVAPHAAMETGEISRKLRKGRNTTRHSELIVVSDGTYICDTPGFTSFVPEEMEKEDLRFYYDEFSPYEGQCRFLSCVHINEPECKVKEALAEGKISKLRYESYLSLYEELKERERTKYS